eukprot:TRINITY_DN2431_c0_g1_i1.p1 TRINITY_DN2431_c0_g1~~TRINITY_DN2431_c0_g1_i1.p1  ORF type:complete len:592 (-),score=133.24 TRINITY_DN2431_c0_g1_i1:171-1946(-)
MTDRPEAEELQFRPQRQVKKLYARETLKNRGRSAAPSSVQRATLVRDGIIHEPIFGLKSHAFGNEVPDFYWATKDNAPILLRVDIDAWSKRDQDFSHKFAQLRKDVFIATSEDCRQRARLWRVKQKKSKDVFKPLLKTVELDPRKPQAPQVPRPHHMPQRSSHPVHHSFGLPSQEARASDSGAVENSEAVGQQAKETQEAKWAEQRLQRKLELKRTREERAQHYHQQLEQRMSRLLENQREKRERVLQFQGAQIKKGKEDDDDDDDEEKEEEVRDHQDVQPRKVVLPKRVSILVRDSSSGSTTSQHAKKLEPTEESEEKSRNSEDGDEDSSDDEEAEAEFNKQQERQLEQAPNSRLTRLARRQSTLLKEERRIKRLEQEEEELLKLNEAGEEPVSKTNFEVCVQIAEMYKVPLKVVQQTYNHFCELDADGNGSLSIDEFEAEIRKMIEIGPDEDIPQHLLKSHWEKIDSNHDNKVDFNEYFLWTMQAGWKEEILVSDSKERQVRELAREHGLGLLDVERVKAVYDKHDADQNGTIDREEFKSVLCSCMNVSDPSQVSQSMLNRYWCEADKDNSGQIDLSEFLIWYFTFFAS